MFMKWWMENLSIKKGLLLLCVISLAGCGLLPKEQEEDDFPVINKPAISEKPTSLVEKKTLFEKVTASGRIMSEQEEVLYFKEEKLRIKDVHVKNSQVVKKGQVLVELDAKEMEKALRLKKIEFRKLELEMKAFIREQDSAELIDVEERKLAFEEQRQTIDDMEKQIADTKLVAPFDGTIVSLDAKKAAQSVPFAPVVTVANTASLVVAADPSKDELKQITVGLPVEVDINNVGKVTGKVKQLPNPDAEKSSNDSYYDRSQEDKIDKVDNHLLIQLNEMPKDLQRGTPLSVTIIIQEKKDAIVIPVSTLRTVGARTYVQVIEDDGKKREVDVEVGLQTPLEVQILKGLQPGQKVVGR